MKAEPLRRYKITIGTDSELLTGGKADFVTAVVVHRVGNGGRYFWRRVEAGPVRSNRASGPEGTHAESVSATSNGAGKFHTLRDRIIKEVLISLDLGKEVLIELRKLTTSTVIASPYGAKQSTEIASVASLSRNDALQSGLHWDFEIHADVGENGETKAMIQEVVGMIRANNFQPITKPGSYAASNVADRHV